MTDQPNDVGAKLLAAFDAANDVLEAVGEPTLPPPVCPTCGFTSPWEKYAGGPGGPCRDAWHQEGTMSSTLAAAGLGTGPATDGAPDPPAATQAVPGDTIAHLAGLNISVKGRFVRQRCAWCGAVIVQHDQGPAAASLLGPDGNPVTGPPQFATGAIVRFWRDGRFEQLQAPLPEDFCGFLDQRVRDAPGGTSG